MTILQHQLTNISCLKYVRYEDVESKVTSEDQKKKPSNSSENFLLRIYCCPLLPKPEMHNLFAVTIRIAELAST